MSKFNRGKTKDNLTFVSINDILFYGFNMKDAASISGVSAGDLTACGHLTPTQVADNDVKILVLSPNAPKPATYRKRLANNLGGQQQSFSTFVGHAARITALGAGFKPAKAGKGVSLRATPRNRGSKITAIAEMRNGLLYCWPMDAVDFAAVGSELGLQNASGITTEAERKVLVMSPGGGCRPGVAEKELDGGGTISSFYSHGTVLPTGWSIKSEESLGIDGYVGT